MPCARRCVESAATVRDLAPETIPADFPTDALVEPQQVIFPAADGLPIHGQLFLPPRRRRRGEAAGAGLLPRRLAAPDAAGLALHVLLQQRLRA